MFTFRCKKFFFLVGTLVSGASSAASSFSDDSHRSHYTPEDGTVLGPNVADEGITQLEKKIS